MTTIRLDVLSWFRAAKLWSCKKPKRPPLRTRAKRLIVWEVKRETVVYAGRLCPIKSTVSSIILIYIKKPLNKITLSVFKEIYFVNTVLLKYANISHSWNLVSILLCKILSFVGFSNCSKGSIFVVLIWVSFRASETIVCFSVIIRVFHNTHMHVTPYSMLSS